MLAAPTSAAAEAVEIFRELEASKPGAFVVDLARTLAVLGTQALMLGRGEQALALLAESQSLAAELLERQDPSAHAIAIDVGEVAEQIRAWLSEPDDQPKK